METMVVPARGGPRGRAEPNGFVWHRFQVLLDPRDVAILRLLRGTMKDEKGDIPDRAAVIRHGLAVLAERALSPEQIAGLPARSGGEDGAET